MAEATGTAKTALAELAGFETVSQTADWIARYAADLTAADGALVWTVDLQQPGFRCTGGTGTYRKSRLRSLAMRQSSLVKELLRSGGPLTITPDGRSDDPFLGDLQTVHVVLLPLQDRDGVHGIVELIFSQPATGELTAVELGREFDLATTVLSRVLRREKKQKGMLQAIERLTNLYDLTKAFGSTIDMEELSAIIAAKAVLFGGCEVASLWFLDREEGEVLLGATATNENYAIPDPPASVGSSIIGEIVSGQTVFLVNEPDGEDEMAGENPRFPVRSYLAGPLLENDECIGGLVLVNKRGRHAEFTHADQELLTDLCRQAARALHNARQYEAQKKVEELDALLAVSREITATLDLDKVLKTIVNATAALITYDRCAIAILQKGKLQVNAISGALQVDRRDPSVKRTEDILQWVFFAGSDIAVVREEDGAILTDRPETEEKFRAYFDQSGMNSFFAAILRDEEGNLGVLSFESGERFIFDSETRDLLQILLNQATVAVRNAQLYQQVPLAGFWKPLMERRRRAGQLAGRRRLWVAAGIAIAALLLIVVPWPIRIEAPARILPDVKTVITAPLSGVLSEVKVREGDVVSAGAPLALLRDDESRSRVAEADSKLRIAESEVATQQALGHPASAFQAAAIRDEMRANLAIARDELDRTVIRAPRPGVVLTPRLSERVGQYFEAGDELAALGDISSVVISAAVPEDELQLVRRGQRVAVKMNPFPTRTFHGTVARIGVAVHEEGDDRFVLVESRVPNPNGELRPGMLGRAKIAADSKPLGVVIFRRPARYVWKRLWLVLP